jgi:uncharacterized membrane protein YhaH (DUF805 family)
MEIVGSVVTLVSLILGVAIAVVPVVKILRKAGFNGWWSILYLIPLVNLVALYLFAFTEWPSERRR